MSTKEKNPVSLANYPQSKNINLPRLDRIILRNAANRNVNGDEPKKHDRHERHDRHDRHDRGEVVSLKPHQVDISNMLKIEGKGSNQGPRYDYEYELARKQADRDIRAELRKIYNLKPSPKKHSRRIVELPRLN